MRANELIRQYQAKTITAREFIEGVWKEAHSRKVYDISNSFVYQVTMGGKNKTLWYGNEAAAQKEAAAFTISRIEEIGKIKEEIAYHSMRCGELKKMCSAEMIEAQPAWFQEWGILDRTIGRAESALAELSRGVRPEVLA